MSKLEPGKYVGKVVNYVVPEPVDGKDKVILTWEITVSGNVTENHESHFYLTDKAAPYTIEKLLTAGLVGDLASLVDEGAFDGREVLLVLENEEYNGKTHLRVKWVNPIGGSTFREMDVTAAGRLDRFKGLVAAKRQELGVSEPEPDNTPF